MQVFHTTTTATAREILKDGFQDRTALYGMNGPAVAEEHTGIWFADTPLGINDGFDEHTTLSLDVPEEVFTKYEWAGYSERYRFAIIPAEVVNDYGKAKVHNHEFAMSSRRDLASAAARWEAGGRPEVAAKIREAIQFFDEVGWQNIATSLEEDA